MDESFDEEVDFALADPSLFGGYWTPWLDNTDAAMEYLRNEMLSDMTLFLYPHVCECYITGSNATIVRLFQEYDTVPGPKRVGYKKEVSYLSCPFICDCLCFLQCSANGKNADAQKDKMADIEYMKPDLAAVNAKRDRKIAAKISLTHKSSRAANIYHFCVK